jgi:NADH dehydrogenase
VGGRHYRAGVLRTLGLPVSKMGQIVVGPTLQSETDPDIFAFGDCAAAPWPEKQTTVPPRAQAAHQQATFLYDAMRAAGWQAAAEVRLQGFRLAGVAGHFSAVGSLMGGLIGGSMFIEG